MSTEKAGGRGEGGKPVKPSVAKLIPGFELTLEIGQGGMGHVFKARQLEIGRWVALKILKKSLSDDKDYVTRFLSEARTAGKLRHENIVSALDCGVASGRHYIVMEFVEGKPLDRILKERGLLPEREALELVRQVAQGLQFAWNQKIIHRDIKPQNVLVTPDGTAKICDLGLSRDIRSDSTLTATGTVHCTPTYASPEQARGYKDLDTRTDLYSLGATLYELVVGRPPFEGQSSGDLFIKHATEKPPPPKSRNSEITPETNRLILHLLEKNREKRPASPGVLVERIDSILSGKEKVTALKSRTRRAAARGPAGKPKLPLSPLALGGILGGAAVVLLLVGILIFGGGSSQPAPYAPRPAAARPQSASARPSPAPIPPPPKVDPAVHAIRALEKLAQESKDPNEILLRCDSIRDIVRGTPHEKTLKRIEEDAVALRRRGNTSEKTDQLLQDLDAIEKRDTTFARYQEVTALLKAAVAKGGDQAPRLETAYRGYLTRFKDAARFAADAISRKIADLGRKKRYLEALTLIDQYPPAFRRTPHWPALEATRGDLLNHIREETKKAVTTTRALRTLKGHTSWVLSSTFSPDGKLLATGSADKTLRLWNRANGTLKSTLRGHQGMIQGIAFTPDGKTIATATENFERKPDIPGELKLWGAASGRLKRSLDGPRAPLYDVAISPDGRTVAAAGRELFLRTWDLPTGTLRMESRALSSALATLTFSPDGQALATGGWFSPIRIWDLRAGNDRMLPSGKGKRGMTAMAFSPDGRTLATGDKDGRLYLWDMLTDRMRISFAAHEKSVNSIRFTPEGKHLVSGGADTRAKIWDAATGLLRATLSGHLKSVSDVAVAPDGVLLATASHDATVRLWDLPSVLGQPRPAAAAIQAPPQPGVSAKTAAPPAGIPTGLEAGKTVWKALIAARERLRGKPIDLKKRGLKGAKYSIRDITQKGLVLEVSFGGGTVANTERQESLPVSLIASLVDQGFREIPPVVRRALIVYADHRGERTLAREELRKANAAGVDVSDIDRKWKREAQLKKKKDRLVMAGGGPDTEAAVQRGLRWLARHQADDGGWQVDTYVKRCGSVPGTEGQECSPNPGHNSFDGGVTGLSLLAFLGAGYGPDSSETHDGIRFGSVVRKGIDWIISNQDPEGCITSRTNQKYMYNHLMCALALLKAYRLTEDRSLKDPAWKAADFTVSAQSPGKAWRYSYRSSDNDSSVAGWAVKVLHEAEKMGYSVPASVTSGIRAWFTEVSDDSGRVGYTKKGTGKVFVPGLNESFNHHEALGAIGILVKILVDKQKTHPLIGRMMAHLTSDRPFWGPKSTDFYYWYYGTEAVYLVDGPRGAKWKAWNASMKKALLTAQAKGGCRDGCWETVGRWSGEGGRVYGTAMNVLTLETYYRVDAGP